MLVAVVGDITWFAALVFVLDWVLRLGTAARVVMRRLSVGVAMSWLLVVMFAPFVGVGIYWVFGEIRVGRRRAIRALRVRGSYEQYEGKLRGRSEAAAVRECLEARFVPIATQAEKAVGVPALPGNALSLIPETTDALREIAEAINGAQSRVDMVYYIFMDGGDADLVIDALCAAQRRGVTCRVLVDALGSRSFLKRSAGARRLRDAGVALRAALPAGLLRMLIRRIDLRNHRKLTVVDGEVAFTGSMNLLGPKRLRASVSVGPWVDAAVRVAGPAVGPLYAAFLEDWEAETGETTDDLDAVTAALEPQRPGGAWVQVVPSGPHVRGQSIRELVLSAVYAARESLVVTTPYFVPDDALLVAMTGAAARGVEVTLVIPEACDSMLAAFAGNASLTDLMEAGVAVQRFRGGLLHTKSITVDGAAAMVGTVNFDMRSFYLNFELSLLVYDGVFAEAVGVLQQGYVARSVPVDLEAWRARPAGVRFLENVAKLLGPLL